MELKTLQGIEEEPEWSQKVFDAEGIYISPYRLRQEAIKHYKNFRRYLDKQDDLVNHCGISMTCNFIKDFFNLTEEDILK